MLIKVPNNQRGTFSSDPDCQCLAQWMRIILLFVPFGIYLIFRILPRLPPIRRMLPPLTLYRQQQRDERILQLLLILRLIYFINIISLYLCKRIHNNYLVLRFLLLSEYRIPVEEMAIQAMADLVHRCTCPLQDWPH